MEYNNGKVKNMKEITREGCGVPDCIFNKKFRCTLLRIKVDNTSKCASAFYPAGDIVIVSEVRDKNISLQIYLGNIEWGLFSSKEYE